MVFWFKLTFSGLFGLQNNEQHAKRTGHGFYRRLCPRLFLPDLLSPHMFLVMQSYLLEKTEFIKVSDVQI